VDWKNIENTWEIESLGYTLSVQGGNGQERGDNAFMQHRDEFIFCSNNRDRFNSCWWIKKPQIT
jgi:hypothetical protein